MSDKNASEHNAGEPSDVPSGPCHAIDQPCSNAHGTDAIQGHVAILRAKHFVCYMLSWLPLFT